MSGGGGIVGVMDLRRRLMMAMASGAQFYSGTFTTPTSQNTYTLSLPKPFNKYMFFVEMTGDSKTALKNTGNESSKTFFVMGKYPEPTFDNANINTFYNGRYKPSAGTVDSTTSSVVTSIDNSSITFTNRAITYGANVLYQGYTYNYYIVEIK